MTLLPVIARELRAQSRQPFTYWVRVLGAGALLVTVFIFLPDIEFGKQMGVRYFAILHRVLFFSIWILVPMMTADCISRERREGTLPLLFLTLLKPKDIVLAKSFVHGLRAATLCVAVVPVFTICFLMGGVSWEMVVFSFLINLSSLCFALAAGLWASSLNKAWSRSLLSAAIWSVVFFLLFAALFGGWIGTPPYSSISEYLTYRVQSGVQLTISAADLITPRGLLFTSNPKKYWSTVAGVFTHEGKATCYSIIGLWIIIFLAARNVRRNWQEKPPSRFQLWWEKYFCTPVVMVSIFERWMKFKLERNPIGWLEVRTWSGRLVIWGWFAVMISLLTLEFWDANLYQNRFHEIQSFMAWLLMWSIASSSAGSFRRERETGVLELLLVSPLRVQDIINGRLRGLWGQFLPAILLLLGVWVYWSNTFEKMDENRHILFFSTTFATLPVIGLYCSLSSRNFIAALLRTFLWAVVLPMFAVPMLFSFLARNFWAGQYHSPILISLLQILFAFLSWQRLFRNLNERKFSLERAMN